MLLGRFPIIFLSTLSLRRATLATWQSDYLYRISIHALLAESDDSLPALRLILCHFYPRSPCGERRPDRQKNINGRTFLSTLSLRRATRYGRPIDVQLVFLSTLSLRRATVPHVYIPGHRWISIHALLAESDTRSFSLRCTAPDFYPRSPCGERPGR